MVLTLREDEAGVSTEVGELWGGTRRDIVVRKWRWTTGSRSLIQHTLGLAHGHGRFIGGLEGVEPLAKAFATF